MHFFIILNENYQKTVKDLLKTGQLTKYQFDEILQITGGDKYTYILAQYYMQHKGYEDKFYDRLKRYYERKNILSLDVDLNKTYDQRDILNLFYNLKSREEILATYEKFGNFEKRNLKKIITGKIFNTAQIDTLKNRISYLYSVYTNISNRDEDVQKMLIRKGFNSSYDIDDMIDFFESKENIIGDVTFTEDDLYDIMNETDDAEIVYKGENFAVVKITSVYDMQKLGCNTFWCFSYPGSNYRQFMEYSYNDTVYMIFDFSERKHPADKYYVLIMPPEMEYDDEDGKPAMYDAFNDPVEDTLTILKYFFKGVDYSDILIFE
jgi:hypothetical protein